MVDDPYVVDLEMGRQIFFTEILWKSAGTTTRIAAIVALAHAVLKVRIWKGPVFRNRRVDEQVHGLTGNLGVR